MSRTDNSTHQGQAAGVLGSRFGPLGIVGQLAIVVAVVGMVGMVGCGSKSDGTDDCPYWHDDPCSEHGIPDEDRAAFCDECDVLWVCSPDYSGSGDGTVRYTLLRSGYSCECVDETGHLWWNTPDAPAECQETE